MKIIYLCMSSQLNKAILEADITSRTIEAFELTYMEWRSLAYETGRTWFPVEGNVYKGIPILLKEEDRNKL